MIILNYHPNSLYPLHSFPSNNNRNNNKNYHSRIIRKILKKRLSSLSKGLVVPPRYLDDNNHLTSIFFNGKLLLKPKYLSKEISYTLGDEGCLYYCMLLVYNTNTYPPNKDVLLSKHFHLFYHYNVHRQQAKHIRAFISKTITSANIRFDKCNIVLDFYLNYPDFDDALKSHQLKNTDNTSSSYPQPYFVPEGGKTIQYPSSDKVLVKSTDNIRRTSNKSFLHYGFIVPKGDIRHYHSDASSISKVFQNPIPSTYVSSTPLVYSSLFRGLTSKPLYLNPRQIKSYSVSSNKVHNEDAPICVMLNAVDAIDPNFVADKIEGLLYADGTYRCYIRVLDKANSTVLVPTLDNMCFYLGYNTNWPGRLIIHVLIPALRNNHIQPKSAKVQLWFSIGSMHPGDICLTSPTLNPYHSDGDTETEIFTS